LPVQIRFFKLSASDLDLVTLLMTASDEAQAYNILLIPDDVRAVVTTPLASPLETSYDQAARERVSMCTRKCLEELGYYDYRSEAEPA